jgi:hypothetical protein
MCQVQQPSGSVAAAVVRCEGDLHRPGLDPHRTTSHIPSREVGALLDTAAEVPRGIILSVDEIDDDRTDTFRPFVSDKAQAGATPEAFLSQITFEGDEDLQRDCRALCLKYADMFSDTMAPLPFCHKSRLREMKTFNAIAEPSVSNMLTCLATPWLPSLLSSHLLRSRLNCSSGRRAPVRPQSAKKDFELDKALKEMLLHKIIEKSNALYYSHPVIVQRTANTFRFCIDFRNLNGCTKPANWPVPLIQALFARRFHQAPLAEAAKILTAFACFAGVYQFTRLPFGLKHAPSYFQEQMATSVLYGLIYTICEMYIDDCIVYTDSNA